MLQVFCYKNMVLGASDFQIRATREERPQSDRPLHADGVGANSSSWMRLGKVQWNQGPTGKTVLQLRLQLLSRVSVQMFYLLQ